MANSEHADALKAGVDEWNKWRYQQGDLHPDLSMMSLSGKDLRYANLSWCDLSGSDLSNANLTRASLFGSNLSNSKLNRAMLTSADLRSVSLSGAEALFTIFGGANLQNAVLDGADVHGSDFSFSNLCGADIQNANFRGCCVHGMAAWRMTGEPADESSLTITLPIEPDITVDNLEIAQFLYLLLNNQKIRHVIDNITSKVVLILGRFTPERKAILDAIRDELRKRDCLPVLFDFEKPANRDITETVSTLAHMARFVIADITDARSIPQELMAIVPTLPSVPVQPLLLASQHEYGMFKHFKRFPWVLEPYLYKDQMSLLASLESHVVGPAEAKAREQIGR